LSRNKLCSLSIGDKLYTGPPYVKFNSCQRDPTSKDFHGNFYINSLFASASSLRNILVQVQSRKEKKYTVAWQVRVDSQSLNALM